MRKRANSAASQDSLELLLDVVCNTFGGILFLSILLAIMLKQKADTQAHAPEEAAASEMLASLQEQERLLRSALAASEAVQAALASSVDDSTSGLKARDLAANTIELQEKAAQSQSDRANKQKQIEAIAQARERINAELQRAGQAAAASEERVRKAMQKAADKLPQQKRTSKRSVGFALRYGRFYRWEIYNPSTGAKTIDLNDMIVSGEDNENLLVTPNPASGAVIDIAATSNDPFEQRIAGLDWDEVFAALVVFPDSYKEFAWVRNQFVERRINYQLFAITADGSVANHGGSRADVQ